MTRAPTLFTHATEPQGGRASWTLLELLSIKGQVAAEVSSTRKVCAAGSTLVGDPDPRHITHTTIMSPHRRRPRLLLDLSVLLPLLILSLLPTTTEAKRNSKSVRRQTGQSKLTGAAGGAAAAATAPLPFVAMPGKDSISKPTFDETGGIHEFSPSVNNVPNKEAMLLRSTAGMESLSSYEGAEVIFHPHLPAGAGTLTKSEFDEFQDEEDDEPTTDPNGTSGDAPYDGDDETTDGVLALYLLGLVCWIASSILLVVCFVRTEKRREEMLRFWRAIDTNPDLRQAVEQAAGGRAFPKFTGHAGFHRFLRAIAVALVVTVGLNLVFYMAQTPVPNAVGGKGEGGGEEEGGTGGGENDLPLDPTGMGDDGLSDSTPVMGMVVLFLLLASMVLLARGLYAVCCATPSSSPPSASCGGQQPYPGSVGGNYEPVHPATVTPYISMHGNSSSSSSSSSSNSPAQEAYYIGVHVLPTSPPSSRSSSPSFSHPQQQQQVQEDEIEEGAPPPYSAALVAAPVSSAMVV